MSFTSPFLRILFCLITLLCIGYTSIAQGIHPQNLFDAGLNVGYLDGHHVKGVEQPEAPIWAGNASAEWLNSWMPGAVTPVTPDLQAPSKSHEEMLGQIRQMPACSQAYFNLRLSLYNLGYALGHAVVETGYDCTACLKIEMQKAAIELRTIGRYLTSAEWQNLSVELNNDAQSLDMTLSGELEKQENAGRFTYLQTVLDRVNQLLPDELILCSEQPDTQDTSSYQSDPDEEKDKRRNRKMVIMGGWTSAVLKGDSGTDSKAGNGFFLGFDIQYGRPVFFNGGVDFFRNSAGKEFFVLVPGQIADPGEYIQSFRLNLGIGGYLVDKEDLSLCIFANGRILTSTSINGDLISYGNVNVEDRPIHLNIGSRVNVNYLTAYIGYEFGLSPIITTSTEDFKYNIWHIGLGVNF